MLSDDDAELTEDVITPLGCVVGAGKVIRTIIAVSRGHWLYALGMFLETLYNVRVSLDGRRTMSCHIILVLESVIHLVVVQ